MHHIPFPPSVKRLVVLVAVVGSSLALTAAGAVADQLATSHRDTASFSARVSQASAATDPAPDYFLDTPGLPSSPTGIGLSTEGSPEYRLPPAYMAQVPWLYYYYTAKVISQEGQDKFHGFPETIAQQAMEEAIDGNHGNITHGNGGYIQYKVVPVEVV